MLNPQMSFFMQQAQEPTAIPIRHQPDECGRTLVSTYHACDVDTLAACRDLHGQGAHDRPWHEL